MKPFVSVIIPCRNEAGYLGACLDSVLASDYPRMEILIADGMSRDGTRELAARYAAQDARIRCLDNPRGITPAALNLALDRARGEVIVRVDAHAAIAPDYISRSVECLESSGADNVGGVMRTLTRGGGVFAEPIRIALSHWFGVGNSRFRTGAAKPCWVDTVFGGCWRREVFERVGKFNERLARGQDMEFNIRLKRAGGKILLDPAIESRYFARAAPGAFLKHNWTNGVWAVLPFGYSRQMPVKARHLAPLAFVSALGASAWPGLHWLLAAVAAPYVALSLAVSCAAAWREKNVRLAALLPVVFFGLHFAYGMGSAWGVARLAAILRRGTAA